MNLLLLLPASVVAYVILSTLLTWWWFIKIEDLEKRKNSLTKLRRAGADVFLFFGVWIDAGYNATTGNIIFAFKQWKTAMFTRRLENIKAGPDCWQRKIAVWICAHMLDNHTWDGKPHCK